MKKKKTRLRVRAVVPLDCFQFLCRSDAEFGSGSIREGDVSLL